MKIYECNIILHKEIKAKTKDEAKWKFIKEIISQCEIEEMEK
jgi:hypothetical protein